METSGIVMSITDEQIAEIEALAGKAHESTADLFAYGNAITPSRFLALISRLRAAERDAARYRWIVPALSHYAGGRYGVSMPKDYTTSTKQECDAAIDTAMKGDRQ